MRIMPLFPVWRSVLGDKPIAGCIVFWVHSVLQTHISSLFIYSRFRRMSHLNSIYMCKRLSLVGQRKESVVYL